MTAPLHGGRDLLIGGGRDPDGGQGRDPEDALWSALLCGACALGVAACVLWAWIFHMMGG